MKTDIELFGIRLRYAELTLAGNGERAPALPPFVD
jgi:hypothetical protein